MNKHYATVGVTEKSLSDGYVPKHALNPFIHNQIWMGCPVCVAALKESE